MSHMIQSEASGQMPGTPRQMPMSGIPGIPDLPDQNPSGNLSKDAAEILDKVESFQTDHAQQLAEFNKFYKMYRVQPTKTRRENQSNTVLPEMFVEVEAIATSIHEMIFSDNSDALFFDVVGEDGGEDDRIKAIITKATIAKQLELNGFQPKMLPFLRMVALLGSFPAALPWVLAYKSYWDNLSRVRRPAFDCWSFDPFSVVNFSFDDTEELIDKGEWAAQTMHVRGKAARAMVREGVWSRTVVDGALESGIKRNVYEEEQRHLAGYFHTSKEGEGFTAHEYYGTLASRDDGETYWAVINSEGKFLKEPEINPYAHGEKPWLMGNWFNLPGEPYAMGIGHINYRTNSEINDRRNFINDLLYASLYNMWLRRSDSGIVLSGGNKMQYSPHQIIDGDGITDEYLRALRPDMSGLGPAINLEGADIEKMRRHSGATTTLQAVATGITATETQSIQSEATRRVKAMVRSNIAALLRNLLYRVHSMNLQFLDRPLRASVTGDDGLNIFGSVTRVDLLRNADIKMKLTTDLDFRPFKRKELLEMLDIFSRLESSGRLGSRKVIPDPIIEELAATYGLDPRRFFSKEGVIETETRRATTSPEVQRRAMNEMVAESPGAAQVASQMGGLI